MRADRLLDVPMTDSALQADIAIADVILEEDGLVALASQHSDTASVAVAICHSFSIFYQGFPPGSRYYIFRVSYFHFPKGTPGTT